MLQPSQYATTAVATLLHEAARGTIGFDQRVYDAILARPEEAAEALLAHGMNPPADSRFEIDADIVNLLSAMPQVDALEYVVKILREGFEDLPVSFVTLVRGMGERAVQPLIDVYREMEEDSSGEVAFLLASLGLRDERIAQLIAERLEYDMEDGAMLAGLYGDRALLPKLEKLLAEVGRNRELEFAIETLKSDAPPVPEPPFEPRNEYPETAMPAFDMLEDQEIFAVALEHEEEATRVEALDILEDLELSTAYVQPLLGVATQDASLTLRAAAWRTLNRLNRVQEVREAAAVAFADTSLPRQVRVAALIALLPQYPLQQWKPALEEFLNDPSSRADAVQAMWRSREPVFRSSFGVFLDDPDLKVRIQAIRGAGVMGDKTAIGKLRAAFADEDLRKDALFAYAMAVPSEVSASRMRSLLNRIDAEAGGLLPNEATNVQLALDMRLEAAGKAPIFFPDEEEDGHVHGPDCGHVH